MAGKVVTTSAPSKQEAASAKSYVGGAAKQFQGSAKVQEKVGSDARNVNYYRGSAAYSVTHPGSKYNHYEQNQHMDAVRGAVERDQEIGQLNEAYDYLGSGKTNRESTTQWIDMANERAQNAKDEDIRGEWMKLVNNFNNQYQFDSYTARENNLAQIAELDKKIQDVTNKARSASDVITYWDSANGSKPSQERANYLNYQLKQLKFQKAALEQDNASIEENFYNVLATDEEKAAISALKEGKYGNIEKLNLGNALGKVFGKDNVVTGNGRDKNADLATAQAFYDRVGMQMPAYFNNRDAWGGKLEGTVQSIAGNYVSAAGLFDATAKDQADILLGNKEATGWDTALGILSGGHYALQGLVAKGRDKLLGAGQEQIGSLNRPEDGSIEALWDAYNNAKTPEERAAIQETLNAGYTSWLKNIGLMQGRVYENSAWLENFSKATTAATGAEEIAALESEYREREAENRKLNKSIREARVIAEKYNGDSPSYWYALRDGTAEDRADALLQLGFKLDNEGKTKQQGAESTVGPIERRLMQAAGTALEIGTDAAVAGITGGGPAASKFSLGLRVFGGTGKQAIDKGASISQATLYGYAKASAEIITEAMFDFAGGLVYGKSFTGDLAGELARRLSDNPVFRRWIIKGLNVFGEGAEEGASDFLGIPIEMIIDYNKDQTFWQNLSRLSTQELASFWEDMLMGSFVALLGLPLGDITGTYKSQVEDTYTADLEKDDAAHQSIVNDTIKQMQAAARGNVNPVASVMQSASAGGTRALTQRNVQKAEQEGVSKLAERGEKDSAITKARQKMYDIGRKYPDGNIPAEERLTRQEASMLIAAGYPRDLIEDMAIPRGTRLATKEEIAEGEQKRTKDIKGYVERMLGTDITRRGAERGKARDEEKAKAEEQKRNNDTINSLKEVDKSRVDTSDTINSDIKKTAAQNISAAEEQLGIAAKEGQSVTARLSAIENELGIKPENGSSITARIDVINKALYGENNAPSEIASNAPNSQDSSEGEITQEQTEEKVKPSKESKSKKPKKPKKNKKAKEEEKVKAGEAAVPESNEPAEQSQTEATTEEPPAEPIEQQNSEEPLVDQQQQEEPPAEEPAEEAEEPTGLEAEIRNAKSLEELISLYNRDKHEFNSLYASKWGGGFAVDNQFAKDDLRNLFNDLHPDKQISSKPAATKTEVKQEANTEAASEENNETKAELETTTEKNKQNALNQIKNFELTQERLIELVNGKVLTMEEAAEAIGHKFHDAKEFVGTPEEIAKKEANRDKTKRQQLKRWYVQEKAKFNSDLLTEEEKTRLETANKVKERSKKQAEKVSDERAQDKADEEAGLKAKNKTDDLTNSLSRKIPWREPTDEDYDNIRQWMVDQITTGELTAEEIAELFQKSGHTGDVFSEVRALMQGKGDMDSINEKINSTYSQRLIDLANSELTQRENESGVTQAIIPSMVREYLIRGFNDLTNMDVGLKGESVQLEDIQQALNEWRGKEAPKLVSRAEIRKKAAEQKAARDAAIAKFEAEQKTKTSKKQTAPVVVVQEAQKEASKEKKAKAANPAAVAKEKTLKGMKAVADFARSSLENSLPNIDVSSEDAAKIFSEEQIEAFAKQHKISAAEVKVSLNNAAKELFGKSFKGNATDAKQADLVKAIDKLRSKGVKKNVQTNGENGRRVIPSLDSIEKSKDSSGVSATEHWTEKSRTAYRGAVEGATEKGAKFVGYEETKGATRRVVDRLLNGIPDSERSRIPAVTVLDCSKMSKEDFNETVGAVGLVIKDHPECGIVLFINTPGVGRNTPGTVAKHEPTHYFWMTADIDLDTTTESVLKTAAVDDDAFNKIYSAELAFSGYDVLQGYLEDGQSISQADYDKLLAGPIEERDAKLEELTGDNYFDFLEEMYEEAGANVAAGNAVLDQFGIKVGDYQQAMRNALYDSNVVPRGYYEALDADADEFGAEQAKISEGIKTKQEEAQKEKNEIQQKKEKTKTYIQKFVDGLRAKNKSPEAVFSNPKSDIVQAISKTCGVTPETVVKEANKILNPTKTKKLRDTRTGEEIPSPHGRAISEASTKYWLGRNVTPEGAINTRTNKEYSKYTTEAERIRNGGPIEYRSISDVSVAKTAGENVFDGLAKYGYEAVAESYKALAPNLVNDKLVAREIVSLAQAIHQELWYRSQHPGKTLHENLAHSNEVLTADEAALWTLARQITGEAASVLRRTTVLTPELQTINNFIQTWAKDKTPESIDQNSDAAKMIQFGQDTVARVKEIEEDFNAGNEEQARKAMIDVIKEVNKVRNTRGLFADQIVGGKQLGKAMDFVEASLLNRVLKESDFNTIKMMALGSVNRINSDFEKVGKLNTVNQLRYANMLSNFATTVNNLLNNLESATTGALANNIAYDLLNKKTTRIMGEQTLVRSNNDWFSRLAVRSEKRAKNKELNRYMWTKGAESVLSLMYGLDVDEGKIDLDLGAKHNQNSGELGQLMARYQFLTGLKMQTTDAMAIARAYKAMEININSLPISNERKAELRNLAMQEARTQMYHNEDNGVAKALLKARETLDKAHFGDSSLGLGSILVPFVQVPVNVATRALEATPAGVVFDLARGSIALHQLEVRAKQYSEYQDAFEAQKAGKELTDAQKEALDKYANVRKPTDAEVHKAARAIGHAATNASIFAVGLLATALKGLKNFDDEDDDELKRLAKEKGWTGLQINMAAMFRPGHEWKDGDPVVGGSWLEVLSIPFAAAYSVANSWMKEDENGKKGGPGAALLAIAKSPLTTFSQAIDVIAGMPGVDQFYDMWTAYQNLQKYEPDEDKRIAKETAAILQYGANTLASFVIPNSMAMTTAGIDNKVRDVYTADNNLQVMGNIIKNKLPYFRGKLPVSRDSLGNVRTYGDNVLMGLVNKSVLPGTGVKIWSRSPIEKEWARLKGEGVGGNLMPKKSAPNNITVDGEKYDFNAEEKRSWDDMNTELCVAGQNILINTEGYQNMTDEEKGAALRDVNTLMALVSNQAALDKKGVDKHVELKGWESAYFGDDNGPDMDGLAKYLVAKHTFKSIWDSKNSTFANLEEADTFIDNIYSKLDQTARDTLDSSYGWLDDFSDARKTTGMSAKEFAAAKEIQEKYRDMQDAMRDMADDDENKESLSALSRNMATEFADYFGDGSKRAKWAQDHLRLWVTISASNDTLEKWQGNTSLSTKEIDSWLDNKSKLVPQGGYKNPSQNQTFMAIRDFNGISASNQSDLEKKRWEMIEMAASKGEDTDDDGEGDGGAWAKLKPYMEQGYSVAYALDHATYWYKQGRRWVQRKYNRIYPKD